MIPAAAVEAAAIAAFERWHPGRSWEASPELQEIFKREAILHLEAAAQHMLAEAWGDGFRAGIDIHNGGKS